MAILAEGLALQASLLRHPSRRLQTLELGGKASARSPPPPVTGPPAGRSGAGGRGPTAGPCQHGAGRRFAADAWGKPRLTWEESTGGK